MTAVKAGFDHEEVSLLLTAPPQQRTVLQVFVYGLATLPAAS